MRLTILSAAGASYQLVALKGEGQAWIDSIDSDVAQAAVGRDLSVQPSVCVLEMEAGAVRHDESAYTLARAGFDYDYATESVRG